MDKPGAPLEKKSEQTNSAPTPAQPIAQPIQSSQTNQNLTTETGGITSYLAYLNPFSYWSSTPASAPSAPVVAPVAAVAAPAPIAAAAPAVASAPAASAPVASAAIAPLKPLAAVPAGAVAIPAVAIPAADNTSVELAKETAKNETVKEKEEEDLNASFLNITKADAESPKKTYKEVLEAGLVSKEVVEEVEAEVVEAEVVDVKAETVEESVVEDSAVEESAGEPIAEEAETTAEAADALEEAVEAHSDETVSEGAEYTEETPAEEASMDETVTHESSPEEETVEATYEESDEAPVLETVEAIDSTEVLEETNPEEQEPAMEASEMVSTEVAESAIAESEADASVTMASTEAEFADSVAAEFQEKPADLNLDSLLREGPLFAERASGIAPPIASPWAPQGSNFDLDFEAGVFPASPSAYQRSKTPDPEYRSPESMGSLPGDAHFSLFSENDHSRSPDSVAHSLFQPSSPGVPKPMSLFSVDKSQSIEMLRGEGSFGEESLAERLEIVLDKSPKRSSLFDNPLAEDDTHAIQPVLFGKKAKEMGKKEDCDKPHYRNAYPKPIESVHSSESHRSGDSVRSSSTFRSGDTSGIDVTEPDDFERRPHSIFRIPGRTPARFLPLVSASPSAPEPSKGASQKKAKPSKSKRRRNRNKWRSS